MLASYVVAFSAMLFSALSALTLFRTVEHLDAPEASPSPTPSAASPPAADGLAASTSRPADPQPTHSPRQVA